MRKLPEITHDILLEEDRWTEALPDYESLIAMCTDQVFKHGDYLAKAKEIELSVTLTNDHHIQQLNNDYRGKNSPTNVLSFPQLNNDKDLEHTTEPIIMLGDVVVALETIEREAIEQNKTLQDHFIHMVIHSILHLLGYDHENQSEAETMEALEIKILSDMGIKNPYQTL